MKHQLLQHYIATLSYRATRSFEDAPENFDSFPAGSGVRTPLEILAHMGDVLTFTLRRLHGDMSDSGQPAPPSAWDEEVARFDSLLKEICGVLETPLYDHSDIEERLLQGPLADVMCHIGQLGMLRRMAGSPVEGENFFAADISKENL
jgi:hypothetical protein